MLKRVFKLSLFLSLLSAIGLAQSGDGARADGFRGLILDQTTSSQAISTLGQPAADKLDSLSVAKIGRWLDAKHKEKIFRHLTFKKIGDFKTIELSFLDDKLVMIELEFGKTVAPERLKNMFAVEFATVGGWSDLPDKPGQYPRPFWVTHYPESFSVVGISDRAFIWANCSADSSGFPLRVDRTRQISRVLEKK